VPESAGQRVQQPADGRPLGRGLILARALRRLDLSPAQRRAMRDVRARYDARMREIGRGFLDGLQRIDEFLFADTPQVDRAREVASELSKLSGERATTRTIVELEVFQLLTPQQRAELRRQRDDALAARGGATVAPAATGEGSVADDLDGGADDDEADDLDGARAAPTGRSLGFAPKRIERPRAGDVLARMALSAEQQGRLRQLRRQRGPTMRQAASRLRAAQRAIDDALLADRLDPVVVRRLAEELGRAESERAMARFETEAAIRSILTRDQAALLRQSRGGR
jgi:Spy/CpxP family protein refolding chaperone